MSSIESTGNDFGDNTNQKNIKILLSYSKFHFDPDKDEKDNPYSNSSAAINAKTLYSVLKNFGDVEYIDFNEWEKTKGKEYDLFVGINHNFDNIIANAQIKTIVYYAVNQHPTERNKIIKNFKMSNRFTRLLPKFLSKLLKNIINFEFRQEYAPKVKKINKADYIICLGNDIVRQSYIKHGFDPQKIISVNYEILQGASTPKETFHDIPYILYVGTNMCERKGFDIVYQLMNKLNEKGYDFKLTVVGDPINKYYAKKCAKLKKLLKDKIEIFDCLYGDTYKNKIKENDFYIYPSIEEGQAGTVLDAMHAGLIPVITRESGVDFSPLGFLQPGLNKKSNLEITEKLFNLSNDEKSHLSQMTADYYNKYHLDFEKRLTNIFSYNIIKN